MRKPLTSTRGPLPLVGAVTARGATSSGGALPAVGGGVTEGCSCCSTEPAVGGGGEAWASAVLAAMDNPMAAATRGRHADDV